MIWANFCGARALVGRSPNARRAALSIVISGHFRMTLWCHRYFIDSFVIGVIHRVGS